MALTKETLPIAQQLTHKISYLGRLQKRYINQRLSEVGIEQIPYRMLLCIGHNQGCSQEFLVEFQAMDKGHVARIVGELTEKGYITRRQSEKDRRYYQLFLTETGETLYVRLCAMRAQWSNEITQNIPPEKLKIALEVLEQMSLEMTEHEDVL